MSKPTPGLYLRGRFDASFCHRLKPVRQAQSNVFGNRLNYNAFYFGTIHSVWLTLPEPLAIFRHLHVHRHELSPAGFPRAMPHAI
jgi:hypothetical protein